MGRKVHQILTLKKKVSSSAHSKFWVVGFFFFFPFFSHYHSHQLMPEMSISFGGNQDRIQAILGKMMKIRLFKVV